MKKAKIVFEVIWILSCILTLLSAFCHWGDVLYSISLGSMWTSLIIKSTITLIVDKRGRT